MAKIAQVPKHVSATFELREVLELVLYLDATAAEFEMNETVAALFEDFKAAYGGDLPGDRNNEVGDGGAVTA